MFTTTNVGTAKHTDLFGNGDFFPHVHVPTWIYSWYLSAFDSDVFKAISTFDTVQTVSFTRNWTGLS